MKRSPFLLAVCAVLLLGASRIQSSTVIPTASSDTLYDYANLVEEPRKTELVSILDRVEKQTGVEMAVVILKQEQNQKFSIPQFEQFSSNMFNQWGIGHKALNNGVMLVISAKDRMMRFQFGSDYTEENAAVVTEKYEAGVLPLFQTKKYSDGIFAASMLALQAAIEDVSWWWYHRVALILFALALIALGGVVWSAKHSIKEGVVLGVVVFIGLTIMGFIKFFPDHRQPGFNGGQTTGVGITRQWASS